MNRLTIAKALQSLREQSDDYARLLTDKALEIGYYAPQGDDPQSPHTRDEVYVIVSGRGYFVNGGARQPFEPGEVLFVKAGSEHRFENFSEDFGAWVIFFEASG